MKIRMKRISYCCLQISICIFYSDLLEESLCVSFGELPFVENYVRDEAPLPHV